VRRRTHRFVHGDAAADRCPQVSDPKLGWRFEFEAVLSVGAKPQAMTAAKVGANESAVEYAESRVLP
jgi:hypothetical protein